MESLSGHIDGKSETFTLIPNPEPGPQEDESDDEEDSERKECPKVRYPADPSPNIRVELPNLVLAGTSQESARQSCSLSEVRLHQNAQGGSGQRAGY